MELSLTMVFWRVERVIRWRNRFSLRAWNMSSAPDAQPYRNRATISAPPHVQLSKANQSFGTSIIPCQFMYLFYSFPLLKTQFINTEVV